jgi:hypothetical protein
MQQTDGACTMNYLPQLPRIPTKLRHKRFPKYNLKLTLFDHPVHAIQVFLSLYKLYGIFVFLTNET